MADRAGDPGADARRPARPVGWVLAKLDRIGERLASKQTGDVYAPMQQGKIVIGVYRRGIVLTGGRLGNIENERVPWRAIVERLRGVIQGIGVS